MTRLRTLPRSRFTCHSGHITLTRRFRCTCIDWGQHNQHATCFLPSRPGSLDQRWERSGPTGKEPQHKNAGAHCAYMMCPVASALISTAFQLVPTICKQLRHSVTNYIEVKERFQKQPFHSNFLTNAEAPPNK